ncbi:MAG: hypothetical protein D6798_18205 [Deltaproteobacteria bacterium]|nr:MAG: hypothetical protein D6798_18205 [Deltaproteobacteria bacterium]
MNRLLLAVIGGAAIAGCGHPKNLQASFGRCYEQTMALQADRGRPTVSDADYPLTGFEGLELRMRVTEESTDQESGEVEAVGDFSGD